MINGYEKHYRSKCNFMFTVADVLDCLEWLPADRPVMFEIAIELAGKGFVVSEPCAMDVLDVIDYGDTVIACLRVDYDSFLLDSATEIEAVKQAAFFNGVEV